MNIVKNKSKEYYRRCYVVKLFLCFWFFISPPFQCLSCVFCYVKNFYYFLGGLHLFGDSSSFLRRPLYNTWKSLFRQLQVKIILSFPAQRIHHKTSNVFYREILLMDVPKIVRIIEWVLLCFSKTHLQFWSSLDVSSRDVLRNC